MSRILAFAPHPDDIEIGCGGTLAAYARQGAEIHLFVATDGGRGGDGAVRQAEQEASARVLGIREVHWGGFEDTRLPAEDALIQAVDRVVTAIHPEIVFVNHHEDTHQDHRRLARAVHSATRHVPSVLAYETPTSREFAPTVFKQIDDTLSVKLKALETHVSQVQRTNITGLNILQFALAMSHFRGVQARVACAEGFMPFRVRL